MKHINLIRGLGILCICSAAASFLFEGWNTFNGLEKYLIFFGFITALFSLGEAFKSSSEALDKIFSGLFLALSPAISAQLGSFIVDGDSSIDMPSMFSPSPLPDGSPLKFICISSLIFLGAMIFRSSQRLKSTSPLPDFIYLVAANMMILIPNRTSEFHALVLLSIFISFILIDRNMSFVGLNPVASSLIRLAPFIFFLGRASLYSSSTSLAVVKLFIATLVFFKYLPSFIKSSSFTNVSYALGYISVVLMGHNLADYKIWTEYTWTLVLVEVLLMLYLIEFKQSLKIGFFFMSFFAWFSFLRSVFTLDHLTILDISVRIALPLAILALSYSYKYGFGFMNSGLLLICTLVHIGYKVIILPVVNMWMVFGLVGIVLLLVSFLIEKPHHKLLQLWEKTRTFFGEEL